jgi:hypothetical protein
MIGQSYQEKLVDQLNQYCAVETGSLPIILEPFQYISNGSGWVIKFFDNEIAGDEAEGGFDEEELRKFIHEEANKIIDSIKALKL